jgi:CheY-like chemotaxis protein
MAPESLRLLVVDDNRDAADSLGIVLSMREHDVRVCYDADGALRTARAFAPDMMMIDLGMPRCDGLQLARLVRQEKALSDTILVAISGYAGAGIEDQARAAGYQHYLLKPIDFPLLLWLLKEARARLRQSSEECRGLVDEIAEMARRQSEIAAEAARRLHEKELRDRFK